MDLSVICNWEEGDQVSLEYISIFGRPWQYRGEGNANIVIALQDNLQVLRLSKVKEGEWIGDWSRHRRKVEREVIFANQIFVPLLGVEYVGLVQAVQIGSDQIDKLNIALRPLRPDYRLHKELKVPFATAHPDFARIHPYPSHRTDYCIEIKPKQGWWPKHLREGIPKSDPKLCTYCLNQFLKLKRSKITRRTAYCPLDLFSGVPDRIIGAIVALISNPQNNLRIFRNGRLVYGENMNESLEFILEEWIQSDCDSLSGSETSDKNTEPLSAIRNFIFLLCLALIKPKRIPEGSRFQDLNEMYENLKGQIREILTRPSSDEIFFNSSASSSTDGDETDSGKIRNTDSLNNKAGLITSCSDANSPLPNGSILSRILEIQKLADIRGGIYGMYKKICPTHTKASVGNSNSGPGYCPLPHMALEGLECRKNDLSNLSNLGGSSGGGGGCGCESCSGDESGSEVESIIEEGDLLRKSEVEWEEEEDEVTIREDEDDVEDEVIRLRKGRNSNCPSASCLLKERWMDEIPEVSLLSKSEIEEMEGYLLAATAKDCSIMITFSPVHRPQGDVPEVSLMEAEADSINSLYSPTSPSITNYKDSDIILEDMNGTFHRVRIGVADLDPKPLSCIVKHFLRDRDMMEDYNEYLNLNLH